MMLPLRQKRRPGTVLPLVAVCLIALVGCVALAIDIGLLTVSRSRLQSAADIASMVGARNLDGSVGNNMPAAVLLAKQAVKDNRTFSHMLADTDIVSVTPGVFEYDPVLKKFTVQLRAPVGTENYGSMKVVLMSNEPTFFARVFGITSQQINVFATGVHRPRDVAIVLDFSGSMSFGSFISYPRGTGTGQKSSLNPDPNFPRFGPWSLYPVAIAGTPNPMMSVDIQSDGLYAYAPGNVSMPTVHGPAIVDGIDPITGVRTGFPGCLVKGVYDTPAWGYNMVGVTPPAIATYKPLDLTNPTVMPAPAALVDQTNASWTYASGLGDKFPMQTLAPSSPPKPADYAHNVQEYVNFLVANPKALPPSLVGTPATITIPDPERKNLLADGKTPSGGTWWEANGYGAEFCGYTMGPGYYGKTFYMWPSDPRVPSNTTGVGAADLAAGQTIAAARAAGYEPGDWRLRFFFNNGTATTLTRDNNRLYRGDVALNNAAHGRFRDSQNAPGFSINYNAVIKWIKGGPQIFPPNLRTGRVLYYDSIPDVIPAAGGTLDQVFWREYINYVLASETLGRTQPNSESGDLYGQNTTTLVGAQRRVRWAGLDYGPLRVTPKANLVAVGTPNEPYMRYDDNVAAPRAHFWFGPLTMMAFMQNYNGTTQVNGVDDGLMAGTMHESQCWQLKAGVQSALSDIKKNHPNDLSSMIFFSTNNTFLTPRYPLSVDYDKMRLTLWYPFVINGENPWQYLATPTKEIRPYNAAWNFNDQYGVNATGNIPRACDGTPTVTALMMAFNMLSANPAAPGGGKARIGANKLVILETDGVPNDGGVGAFVSKAGIDQSYYSGIGTTGGDDGTMALQVGLQMCDPTKADSLSSSSRVCHIHCIAFGDLFEPTAPAGGYGPTALTFMANLQARGQTTPHDASYNATQPLEPYKVILGNYNQRIDSLRQAFQRIMQGDVTLALVE